MSTFIQTRFYNKEDRYVTVWLGFTTEDISAAAAQWKAFAAGYAVSGGKCLWDQILSVKNNASDSYYIPEDVDRIKKYLESVQGNKIHD